MTGPRMPPQGATPHVSTDVQDPAGHIPRILLPWWNDEHGFINGQAANYGDGVVMGGPLWGEDYINRFLFYCMPTLYTEANKAALRHKCRLVLYIDDGTRSVFQRNLIPQARRCGIDVILRPIPDAAMELLYGNLYGSRFRVLGATQNMIAHMAGKWGMAFHQFQVDHTYGPAYFENLLRLGKQHDAIAQISINVDIDSAQDEIEAFRAKTGVLDIPDVELGDLGFRHMHAQCRLHSMNDAQYPDALPYSHRLWWQAEDRLVMHSAHVNAAWLSPALTANAPVSFTSTVDTLLPEFVPPDQETGEPKFYVPTIEDGMTFIEVSDKGKPANRPYVHLEEFCGEFWRNGSFSREYMPYFVAPSYVPIKRQASFIPEEEIKRQFEQIYEMLMVTEEPIALDWLRKRFSSRFVRDAHLPEIMR
jgi:hypothetical protein